MLLIVGIVVTEILQSSSGGTTDLDDSEWKTVLACYSVLETGILLLVCWKDRRSLCLLE